MGRCLQMHAQSALSALQRCLQPTGAKWMQSSCCFKQALVSPRSPRACPLTSFCSLRICLLHPLQLLNPPTLFHSKGKTAAEIAADQGHSGIAQLLQQHAVMRPPFCVSELALLYTLTLENSHRLRRKMLRLLLPPKLLQTLQSASFFYQLASYRLYILCFFRRAVSRVSARFP